ncbi:MAG TPA: phospholipase D-like domain-containing protein [Bacteroidota bacterium]|nr:phospholipase D-like domain-containing protein [Bacteroidota bacterium]
MRKILESIAAGIILSVSLLTLVHAQTANHVVISEVYGGGGNSGAYYKNDFVELYNPTSSTVSLSGWSVQYASATGTGSWLVTNLTGTIAPHGFFLVGEAVGSGGTAGLPTPDVSGTLAMSSTAGKIALVNSTTALSGANPTGSSVIDRVGYGTANGYEGSGPTPAPSNSTSVERKANSSSTALTLAAGGSDEFAGNGYDSDNNSSDFVVRTSPQPQNSASPVEPSLTVGGNGTGSAAIAPTFIQAGTTGSFTIEVAGDGVNTLDSLVIVVPDGLTWSQSAASVTVGGGAAAGHVTVVGDTIQVGHASVTDSDTGIIVIASVTAPDSALTCQFNVLSALNGGVPVRISSNLNVAVIKVIPIIDLHVNDSLGVQAAPYQVGATVSVSGVVTGDFSASYTNIFVQDATAGVCIYRPFRSYNYQVGDSITVTGTITQFHGLLEVSLDSTKYFLHSSGNPLPAPFLLTAHDVNETFNTDVYTEPDEGRLVRINNVTYAGTPGTAGPITDATGTTSCYLPSTWTPPTGTFDLIGILKQFKQTAAAPYTADYEVDPRTPADIIVHPGPVYKGIPYETGITPTSVTIVAPTVTASTETVRYGTTTSYTDSVNVGSDTAHSVLLKNLVPSTIYHYQVVASDNSGSDATGDAIFISGSTSSDSLRIYFNKTVNFSVALAESAKTTDLSKVLLYRIGQAQRSIDMCTYSFSGTVGANIAAALLAAHNRGVKIRVIGEHDNITTAPWGTLRSAGIVVIDDAYDAVDAGAGLMHNKFYVFDHRDTSATRIDWVVTGSWNATDPGTNNDAQNMVEIQDRSLAEAYTVEFNQMWGSSGDSPNQTASRFGYRKSDITPHRFVIGGIPVESYFSPSDKTTSKILTAVSSAKSSVNICMLTFTRDDLAQALIAEKGENEKVRVVLDNNTDTGNEFATLKNAGVDVLLKAASLNGLLHHKYAIVDADIPSESNIVITGSHNWSSSAETANDENTLILHSKRVANLYLQEFKQRYLDAGGTDNIAISVTEVPTVLPTTFALGQNYPNPFNPSTKLRFSIAAARPVTLRIYDILGREVATLVNGKLNPGTYTVEWNAGRYSSGVYFARMESGSFVATTKLMLLK